MSLLQFSHLQVAERKALQMYKNQFGNRKCFYQKHKRQFNNKFNIKIQTAKAESCCLKQIQCCRRR